MKQERPLERTMAANVELTAKMEPFDSFWEAPEDIERGYYTFARYYKHNYLKYLPQDKDANILAISCGPGYFVNLLTKEGYSNVLGIDSDPLKVKYARDRGLNCRAVQAFAFLEDTKKRFDAIFCEQEINHLMKAEILVFLKLCRKSLNPGGTLIIHAVNGANPITGAEGLAQNFDHYNTFTEYTMRQVLNYSGFTDTKVIPLNLYVFYKNPLNYVLIALDLLYTVFFRFSFLLYGKTNKIFTKKIAGICKRPS
jgi:2-polyprenyl-3-methyl-5-hydroxy-6-metoxy-1,4-benzoquinol methylase